MLASRPLVRALLASVALCLTLVVGAAAAFAEEVRVQISTIYAHNAPAPSMDPGLEALASELRSGFSGYNAFDLIGSHAVEVPVGETRTVELPDKDRSVLQVGFPGRVDSDRSLLRLSVGLRGKIAAEVKASPGSTFFQAGLIYEEGILVLAIRADVSAPAAASAP